jgi:sporulation protein YlmC with PRC-barrel domain
MDIHFSTLKQFEVRFSNGEVGIIEDALIDERRWRITRLIVRCGGWFFGARVGVSPSSIVLHQNGHQVLNVDADRELLPSYPEDFDPGVLTPHKQLNRDGSVRSILSLKEMQGFQVQLSRRWSGVVKDLVVDPATWKIRKLVAARGVFFPRSLQEISLEDAQRVTWFERGLLVQPMNNSI